jgi:hypothetical protein
VRLPSASRKIDENACRTAILDATNPDVRVTCRGRQLVSMIVVEPLIVKASAAQTEYLLAKTFVVVIHKLKERR